MQQAFHLVGRAGPGERELGEQMVARLEQLGQARRAAFVEHAARGTAELLDPLGQARMPRLERVVQALVRSGREGFAVVLVDAPVEIRRSRLMRDRELTATEADRMIAVQQPAESKRARSDYVIENGADLAALEAGARRVWTALEARAAR